MPEIARLSGHNVWIDLDLVEHERTPPRLMKLGIRLHLAGLSLSNTISELEKFGDQRSRKAVHDWVQKAELQPTNGEFPNQVALDKTVIRVNDEQFWLYAAVDSETNEFIHIRLFQTRTTERTMLFLRELREKVPATQATTLIGDATHLKTALDRLGLRFQVRRHGNRFAVERVFIDIKRRIYWFSNTPSHVELPRMNRGSKPSPSVGINPKVNTTDSAPPANDYWNSPYPNQDNQNILLIYVFICLPVRASSDWTRISVVSSGAAC